MAKDEFVPHERLWWLHEGNRAVRVGDWKLVAAKGDPWELYDLRTDRAEQVNLAAKTPDKVKELERVWQEQADRCTALARKTLPEQPLSKQTHRIDANLWKNYPLTPGSDADRLTCSGHLRDHVW